MERNAHPLAFCRDRPRLALLRVGVAKWRRRSLVNSATDGILYIPRKKQRVVRWRLKHAMDEANDWPFA